VSGWTGSGALTDTAATADTVSASKGAGFSLSNAVLSSTDGMVLSLKGIPKANLTDSGGGNSFTVSGWTGSGALTDTAATADTVTASKKAGYTLSNAALSSTDGMVLSLKGITKANLTDTGGGNIFTVNGWTGTGSLTGTTDTVTATESTTIKLTNSNLTAGTMSLNLLGITSANLTASATSGNPTVIIDASGFTGTTSLTASGTGNAILLGGSGNGSKLTATGSGDDILIGGPGTDTLTDLGTGRSILIGGGGANTITGNGADILISGTTVYDGNTTANIAALDAILAEWSSTDSYAVRISKISKGVGAGGTDALNAATVHSNGVANRVSDGSGATQDNWFIVSSKDAVTKKANETATIIN
jgi:hypothetical protein